MQRMIPIGSWSNPPYTNATQFAQARPLGRSAGDWVRRLRVLAAASMAFGCGLLSERASAAPWVSPFSLAAARVEDQAVPNVTWNGEVLEPGTLPDAWSAKTAQRVQELQTWVPNPEYSISVSADQRVILLAPRGKTHQKSWKLVQRVLEEFDALLPALPDRDLSGETFRTASQGYGDHRPDAEPVVLIEAGAEGDYSDVVSGLAELHPHLTQWSDSARRQPGFVDSPSQTGAWQTTPDGIEVGDVWRGENELVHRLGTLLLIRSYGPMPHWMSTAVGWHMENAVLGSLYHFPMRNEFISVADHSGWKPQLKRAFKKGTEVEPSHFLNWERSQWNQPKAQLAWGMMVFLDRCRPGELPHLAEAFRIHYKQHSAVDHADGSWSRIVGYQIPWEEQAHIMKEVLGETVFHEAGSFFKSWKAPRKSKSRTARSLSKALR